MGKKLDRIVEKAGASYNGSTQRYDYNIDENYHWGLCAIFCALARQRGVGDAAEALQHYVSLRSHVLSRQERDAGGGPIGWMAGTLINSETVACCALALGAGCTYAYEAGEAPLQHDTALSFFYRPDQHVLSAVAGQSKEGYMCYGPSGAMSGCTRCEFVLRAPGAGSHADAVIASLDVRDADGGGVVGGCDVKGAEFSGHDWTAAAVTFGATSARLEVRCYWHSGTCDMDLACVRVS